MLIVDSILFDDVEVGEGCKFIYCIIDKYVKILFYIEIGFNFIEDRKCFYILE